MGHITDDTSNTFDGVKRFHNYGKPTWKIARECDKEY